MASVTPVEELTVRVCRFATDGPEADGTLAWDHTDLVVVEAVADGRRGTGWTFAPAAAADVVTGLLSPVVVGADAGAPRQTHERMRRAARNAGSGGLVGMAISAVDIALWDLAARSHGLAVAELLGGSRAPVPVYGSGGFTTYDEERLDAQVDAWLAWGVAAVKIKIGESWGSRVERDLARVEQVRARVDGRAEVFVDANGGYSVGQACRVGRALDDLGVTWFEEPVSSDDAAGLARVRAEIAADVTAGEYADSVYAVRGLLDAGSVDCLQLDVTRCGGYTGWLACAAVAAAHGVDVSAHGAPYLTLPVASAVPHLRHLEYFHDHVRIAHELLDGAPEPVGGLLQVSDAPGHGLSLRADVLDDHRIA